MALKRVYGPYSYGCCYSNTGYVLIQLVLRAREGATSVYLDLQITKNNDPWSLHFRIKAFLWVLWRSM